MAGMSSPPPSFNGAATRSMACIHAGPRKASCLSSKPSVKLYVTQPLVHISEGDGRNNHRGEAMPSPLAAVADAITSAGTPLN